MIKQFTILDAWTAWNEPAAQAAAARGYDTKIISSGAEAIGRAGLGFIRPHAAPKKQQSLQDDMIMRSQPGMTMVQDRAQVEVFEDKGSQFYRWGSFLPPTWRFEWREAARQFAEGVEPNAVLVSKADEGASSSNIRILRGRDALLRHIDEVFLRGVKVRHCGGHRTTQRRYVMLQQFIPHEVTWRVNVVGRSRTLFRRFNYPDRPIAQTGRRAAVTERDEQVDKIIQFANTVAAGLCSKWVALDILLDGDQPRLLETSLGWPWPLYDTPECNDAPMFDATPGRRWRDMWEVMLDEYEAGVFNA